MKPPSASVAESVKLVTVMARILERNRSPNSQRMRVIHHEPNVFRSTFSSEIVTCQVPGEVPLRLFCKHGRKSGDSFGHRGGVVYEAAVYRQVLQPLDAGPAFYGEYVDNATGDCWLLIEYVEGGKRVNKRPSWAFGLAARWVGQFHATSEQRLTSGSGSPLHRYTADYYRGWARRTVRFAGRLHERFPWLRAVCQRFEEVGPMLLSRRATVIHGEFYPHNILSRNERTVPVDWESAAIGAGEIDLAALTEGWPDEYVEVSKEEYRHGRWNGAPPTDFEQVLDAASLYLSLRWLGESPHRIRLKSSLWYFERLRSISERLGLLEAHG